MVQITNIFAGVFSMIIGGLLIYTGDPILSFLIDGIGSTLIKLIMMGSYAFFTFIVLIYIPLKLFLSKDERTDL